jgi:hypothetical protein
MGSISAGRIVVLWGGVSGGTGLGDVWVWDGSNWSQSASLGVRADGAVIDTGKKVVFFGGDGPGGHYNDEESFDGSSWSSVT